ncbi:MAG: rhomboid family intramembrane serine protease [Rhodothermia bacterium]|nr:MAG: rhomboid family intramembrane serine protease [Rhodothermia bacterium]
MSNGTYHPPTQFSVFPPVIKNLLILSGLIFFAQAAQWNNLLTYWFALWPLDMLGFPGNPQFWPWQLVTYAFLHANLTHLFFNMFALWMFGVQIENTWGSKRFSVFYFGTVVGAAIVQVIVTTMEPGPGMYPTIGASGGVFGVLLAFGMMFPEQPIYMYFVLPVKAKWFVLGYGLLTFWWGVTGPSTIAHFAHLGGMFFGFIIIQYWRGKLPWKPTHRMYW